MSLHTFAYDGNVGGVEACLAAPDMGLNAQDEAGRTALFWACLNNQTEAVRALLDAGADPNLPDAGGDTPLHRTAYHENVEAARLLVASGARVNVVDNAGRTPLHVACYWGKHLMLVWLCVAGADLTLAGSDGEFAFVITSRTAAGRRVFEALRLHGIHSSLIDGTFQPPPSIPVDVKARWGTLVSMDPGVPVTCTAEDAATVLGFPAGMEDCKEHVQPAVRFGGEEGPLFLVVRAEPEDGRRVGWHVPCEGIKDALSACGMRAGLIAEGQWDDIWTLDGGQPTAGILIIARCHPAHDNVLLEDGTGSTAWISFAKFQNRTEESGAPFVGLVGEGMSRLAHYLRANLDDVPVVLFDPAGIVPEQGAVGADVVADNEASTDEAALGSAGAESVRKETASPRAATPAAHAVEPPPPPPRHSAAAPDTVDANGALEILTRALFGAPGQPGFLSIVLRAARSGAASDVSPVNAMMGASDVPYAAAYGFTPSEDVADVPFVDTTLSEAALRATMVMPGLLQRTWAVRRVAQASVYDAGSLMVVGLQSVAWVNMAPVWTDRALCGVAGEAFSYWLQDRGRIKEGTVDSKMSWAAVEDGALGSMVDRLPSSSVYFVVDAAEGATLRLPPAVASAPPATRAAFMADIEAQGSRRVTQCNVLVVGMEGVGKTHLVRRLVGEELPPPGSEAAITSTVGVDLATWAVPSELDVIGVGAAGAVSPLCDDVGEVPPLESRVLGLDKLRVGETAVLRIMDFAGQDMYHSPHRLFLTSRGGVYLVCVDLSEAWSPSAKSRLWHWMSEVTGRDGEARVLIVGCKADGDVMERAAGRRPVAGGRRVGGVHGARSFLRFAPEGFGVGVVEALVEQFGDMIKGMYVCSAVEGYGFGDGSGLRARVIEEAVGSAGFGEVVPELTGHLLLEAVPRMRRDSVAGGDALVAVWDGMESPFDDVDGVRMVSELVADRRGYDEPVVRRAVSYLHTLGEVLWYEDSQLSSVVFLDVQWVANVVVKAALSHKEAERPPVLPTGVISRSAFVEWCDNGRDEPLSLPGAVLVGLLSLTGNVVVIGGEKEGQLLFFAVHQGDAPLEPMGELPTRKIEFCVGFDRFVPGGYMEAVQVAFVTAYRSVGDGGKLGWEVDGHGWKTFAQTQRRWLCLRKRDADGVKCVVVLSTPKTGAKAGSSLLMTWHGPVFEEVLEEVRSVLIGVAESFVEGGQPLLRQAPTLLETRRCGCGHETQCSAGEVVECDTCGDDLVGCAVEAVGKSQAIGSGVVVVKSASVQRLIVSLRKEKPGTVVLAGSDMVAPLWEVGSHTRVRFSDGILSVGHLKAVLAACGGVETVALVVPAVDEALGQDFIAGLGDMAKGIVVATPSPSTALSRIVSSGLASVQGVAGCVVHAEVPPSESTPLHDAVAAGDVDAVMELLGGGAGLEVRDKDGYTPLLLACSEDQEEVYRVLLDSGADVEAVDADGGTVLHWAALYGNIKLGRRVVHAGCDVNATDAAGRTALHVCRERGHVLMCVWLARAGCDVKAVDANGQTALQVMKSPLSSEEAGVLEALLGPGVCEAVQEGNFSGDVDPEVMGRFLTLVSEDPEVEVVCTVADAVAVLALL